MGKKCSPHVKNTKSKDKLLQKTTINMFLSNTTNKAFACLETKSIDTCSQKKNYTCVKVSRKYKQNFVASDGQKSNKSAEN